MDVAVKRQLTGFALFASASLAGALATFLTHPLDTILVRSQAGSTSTLSFPSLFRGVVPATAGGFLFFGQMQFSYGACLGRKVKPGIGY